MIPKFEHSFLKKFNLVSKIIILSAVCFRDLVEIRIMNYLRAIDSPGEFFNLSVCRPS